MEEIFLLHRPGPKAFQGLSEATLIWKTCLRQVAFLSEFPEDFEQEPGDEIYSGTEAFSFLLEIICGLHSPVVGETEVFGQFKNFVAQLTAPMWPQFFQTLITMAKSLRAEYLVGLGSQGYGSLIRKLTKTDEAVCFFGAGQLVSEILPWLAKEKQLQVVCRSASKVHDFQEKYPKLEIHDISGESKIHACLVVAAPVSDQELLEWLERHPGQVHKILDLRGELENPQSFKNFHFVSLKEVFASIEQNKKDLELKVLGLKKIVQQKAQEYAERSFHRPFGWEDLCV
jgi:glutamyl-tRNA reductase